MVYVMLVVFGLSLGSFVNALVWRLHEQEELIEKKPLGIGRKLRELSIVRGRSMCPNCEHELAAKDLVPVFSWLALRGKCRYCRKPIPDTPLPEILVPILAVLSYVVWPFLPNGWTPLAIMAFAVWVIILTLFVALALYDVRWYLLPDRIVIPLTIAAFTFAGLLMYLYDDWSYMTGALLGALVISGIFFAIWYLSKEQWIGGGDVKIGVALGLLAGSAMMGFLVIFLASVIGTIAALPQAIRDKHHKKSVGKIMIPFGPFLLLATIVVVLFGTDMSDWYTGLMHYEQL